MLIGLYIKENQFLLLSFDTVVILSGLAAII